MPDQTGNTLAITGGAHGTTLFPINIPAFMASLHWGRLAKNAVNGLCLGNGSMVTPIVATPILTISGLA